MEDNENIKNYHKPIEILSTGDTDGIDCSIDDSQMSKLFELVSKNMYSNPIGSLIREITSNCFDSHIEAGVTTPVKIEIAKDEGGDYIVFEDFGIGISTERMEKVYSKYLKSTKEKTADQIGYWGLGSKSPLAYQDMFYLETIFDGILYSYIVHKGEERPRIEKLYDIPTDKHNGSKVKVYIKPGALNIFREEIRRQLCYFDNIYFINCAMDNEYIVYQGDHFMYRNKNQYSTSLHISLGKVAYPINWEEMHMTPIALPLALKFNITDLRITPNRESLVYDEDIKKKIKEKIDLLMNELVEIYNSTRQQGTDDIFFFMKEREEVKRIYFDEEKKSFISLEYLPNSYKSKLIDIEFTPLKGVCEVPKDPFFIFKIEKFINSNGTIKEYHYSKNIKDYILSRRVFRYRKDNINKIKNKYLGEKYNEVPLLERKSNTYHTYKDYLFPTDIKYGRSPFGPPKIAGQFSTNNIKVPKFRIATIKKYKQIMTDVIVKLTESYDRFEVDSEWIKKRKEVQKTEALLRKQKRENKILIYNVENRGDNEKEEWEVYRLEELNSLVIYGSKEDKDLLRQVHSMLLHSKSLRSERRSNSTRVYNAHQIGNTQKWKTVDKALVFYTSKTNLEKVKELPNVINVHKFMEGNHRVFRRYATLLMLQKNKFISNIIDKVNTTYFKEINNSIKNLKIMFLLLQ
jgi:hypothetical protein